MAIAVRFRIKLMRGLVLLPFLALTSGCVAAAIPVLAGGVLARKELAGPATVTCPHANLDPAAASGDLARRSCA